MKSNNDTRIIQKLYRSLLPVQALALGLPAINTLVNSFIVGNYFGENALAAIGLTSPITLCVAAVSAMLCNGSQMVSGRYLGKGDQKGLNSVFTTTLISCVVIGGVISLILILFSSSMAYLMSASGDVGILTDEYINGYSVGVIFSLLTTCLISFLQMEHMKRTSMICTVITLAVNICGNFANALYLNWGIFGVSLFMSIASIASGFTALLAILIKGSVFRFSPASASLKTLWHILSLGFPGAVGRLSNVICTYIVNYSLRTLGGTSAVAAMAVANNIYLAVGNVIKLGNNSTIKIIASVLIGHRDVSTLRELPKVTIKAVFPICAATYALIFIFAKPLALLMGVESASIDLFVAVIRLYNICNITACFVSIISNIYQALGRIWEMCVSYLISNGLIIMFICLVLTKFFGLNIVFCAMWLNELISALLYIVYFIFIAKRLPKSPFEMVYVPDSLGTEGSDCLDMTISDIDSAVEASRRLYNFCIENGFSKRTSYAASLCVEEIAVDAVKNRFENKKSAMDLRVIYENGGLSIMTRDDCPQFNPNEWLKLCSPEDESRSIGIKMAMGMARDTNYVSTMGLNVLMIKL